jgi:hypothetical protein
MLRRGTRALLQSKRLTQDLRAGQTGGTSRVFISKEKLIRDRRVVAAAVDLASRGVVHIERELQLPELTSDWPQLWHIVEPPVNCHWHRQ